MLHRTPLVALLATALAVPVIAVTSTSPATATTAPLTTSATTARPAPTASLNATTLRQQVDAALLSSGATAVAGAVDVEGLGAVLRRGSTASLPPASTQKSFVAIASLRRRGPEARPVTTVARSSGVSAAGNVPGSLFLVAGGDTSLTRAGLQQLANQVRATGIRVVQGHLYLDDSRYDRVRTAPGWKPEWLGVESPPALGAVGRQERLPPRRRVPAGPRRLQRPAVQQLPQGRRRHRRGTVVRGGRPASSPTVTTRAGSRLTDVLRTAVEASDNFVAEMLVKELGAASGDGGRPLTG